MFSKENRISFVTKMQTYILPVKYVNNINGFVVKHISEKRFAVLKFLPQDKVCRQLVKLCQMKFK